MTIRSIHLFILLTVLVSASVSSSQPLPEGNPVAQEDNQAVLLRFETKERDLGLRQAGDSFDVAFRVKNESRYSVRPIAVKKSCACITATFEPEVIEPGKEGILRIVGYVDTRQGTGEKFKYSVLVKCNEKSSTIVQIKGRASKGLQVFPSMIAVRDLPDQSVLRVPVRFLFNDAPLEMRGVRNLPNGIGFELQEPSVGEESGGASFVFQAGSLPTQFDFNLTMVPSGDKPKAFRYRLAGNIDRGFEVYPNLVFFNDVPLGRTTTRTLDLLPLGDGNQIEIDLKPLRVNQELSCTCVPKQNGTMQLEFEVTPVRVGYTRGNARIPIEVEGVSRELVIPFSYEARESDKGDFETTEYGPSTQLFAKRHNGH